MNLVNTGSIKRILKASTIVCAMQLPAAALASQVTLQSNDGALKFVGELVEFTGEHYILETQLGNVQIGAGDVTCEGEACPSVAAKVEQPAETIAPVELAGGPVTLQSFDGALKFVGDLIGITEGSYVIRTALGDLRVSTDSVTCEGASCPSVEITSLEETVEVAPVEVETRQVTLQSFDGDLKFVGDLVEVTNGKYIIRTDLGDLRISASTVSCDGPACPVVGAQITEVAAADENIEIDFRISGSELIGEGMMPLLMSGYAASKDAAVEITDSPADDGSVVSLIGNGSGEGIGAYLVASTTTADSFDDLASGDAQIAMASRRVLPFEAQLLRNSGAGDIVSPDQERVIALDNLTIVTHPNNPVTQVSVEDLRGIYAGSITNWSQIGGNDATINVFTRADGTSARDFFEDRIFETQSAQAGEGQLTIYSDQDMAAVVQADPNAIGYVGYAYQSGAKPLSLVSSCGIASIPDAFSTKTEEYVLGRRMYLYNRADNLDAEAAEFLEFTVSENADAMISKSGFINLDVARRVQTSADPRVNSLQNSSLRGIAGQAVSQMLANVTDYDRLSTTFRFRSGWAVLDEKGRGEMPRLIQYLKDLPEGSEITLVGFTDSIGTFQLNQSLSTSRANQVRSAIEQAAGGQLAHLSINVTGYGEIAPASCNDAEAGRALNRRVEVWVRKDNA